MEGCSKASATAGAASGLPDDPLVEILSRAPAKSVCRFKCASTRRDLITDPDNGKKLRQPMQGLFVQTEVDDNESGRTSFSFIDLTVRSVPLDLDSSFSFLTEMTGIKTFFFLDSCNGLILFGHHQERFHLLVVSYIVCNPTTKQWLAVPPCCGSRAAFSHTYLAFDPAVSSHFHLVQFQMPGVNENVVSLHVYSFETRTWSQNQIDEQNEQGQLEGWHHQFKLDFMDRQFPFMVHVINTQCAFVNGFLHLLVWGSDGQQHILVVDVQGKARRVITAPGTCYLGQSQGHLHCMAQESIDEENVKLPIWVLQDYDTQEWVLKNIVYSLDVFGDREEMPEFQVVDIHQDCNVVFLFNEWSCELIAYNMDSKEVSVIATFKGHKDRSEFARYIPCFSESPALTNKH